jgi:hypothetical protein
MLFDQAPGDRRAGPVELRRAMRRLAEKDDLCIRKSVEERAEIHHFVRLWQGLAKSANDRGRFVCALGAKSFGLEEIGHEKPYLKTAINFVARSRVAYT